MHACACVQYYRDLGFHIALTYLEYWDKADKFTVTSQQRELLQKFQTYKSASLPSDQFDVVFFLTWVTGFLMWAISLLQLVWPVIISCRWSAVLSQHFAMLIRRKSVNMGCANHCALLLLASAVSVYLDVDCMLLESSIHSFWPEIHCVYFTILSVMTSWCCCFLLLSKPHK